eukprot:8890512-Pyramimonas_sp.AAC.1
MARFPKPISVAILKKSTPSSLKHTSDKSWRGPLDQISRTILQSAAMVVTVGPRKRKATSSA